MNLQRPVKKKKAVNLAIDAELLADSKEAGLNLSKVLEDKLRELRRDAFKRSINAEIEYLNQRMEEEGLWSDGLRLF